MICKVCGSEFSIENFDLCPYCMTPIEQENVVESCVTEVMVKEDSLESIDEVVDEVQYVETGFISDDLNHMEDKLMLLRETN